MVEESKIDALVKAAVLAGLDGVEFIQDFNYATLCREYNGIGPEWAGAAARQFVTRRLSIFEPPALIHDMRNYKSDGSRKAFHAANDEFLHNCLKIINAHYHEDEKKYAKARAAVFAMYAFVAGPGGWMAWADCNARNLSRKERSERKESL